jgi:hypothetical protein
VNKFADWFEHETDALFVSSNDLLADTANGLKAVDCIVADESPDALDWTEYDVVTSVKDQVTCDMSSVFAIVGSVEAATAIKRNMKASMSEQKVIDCVPAISNCNMNNTYYIGSIAEYFANGDSFFTFEEEYPYEADKYDCRVSGFSVAA